MVTNIEMKELLDYQFRNPCHLKVLISVTDPMAESSNSVSSTNDNYYSNSNYITNYTKPPLETRYASLEDFYTPLTGEMPCPPPVDEETMYQGYVSEDMSDGECQYSPSSAPSVTITYGEPVLLRALNFEFDTYRGDYPTKINITTYIGETLIESLIVDIDSVVFKYLHLFEAHDKAVITWVESNLPYRRARLSSIHFGDILVLDTSNKSNLANIMDAGEVREISLISKTLPTYDFSFSINNISGNYNTDNPTGEILYFLENQEVVYYWGIEKDNKEVVWVLGGTMLTSSDIQSSSNKLTIPVTDRLSKLSNTFKKGIYRASGITLKDLALEVLEDGGITEEWYILDDYLDTIITKNALPLDTHKACLQIIANMSGCLLFTNRNGKICIKKINNELTDNTLFFNDILGDVPKTNIIQKMKELTTNYTTYTLSSNNTLATLETTINGTEDIEISYDNSVDVTATISGGTINSANYYGRTCMLNVTANGNVTITVSGKKLNETSTNVKKQYGLTGITSEVNNPLLSDRDNAIMYLDFIASTIENRHTYECDFRGNPLIDVGDTVLAETKFTQNVPSIITKTEIDYQGSFAGKIKFTKQEEV